MLKKSWLIIGLAVIILSLLWLKGAFFLDPDFGWHLTMGEYIQAHGIPPTDPFSYTMPSYPFVDHEWLTNLLIAKAMPVLGYNFLAGLFALLALGALLLSLATVTKKTLRFASIPLLLTGTTLFAFAGVRPQVITWFFFALLWWIVRSKEHFLQLRWTLPLLFVLWVNLHGGFAIGIVTLFLACSYWVWKKQTSLWSTGLLCLLCLSVTVITPYGYRNWWEVWMQMTDATLKVSIQEWLPAFYQMDLAMWIFVALSVVLVLRNFKKFTLLELALYFLLFVAALSSIRQMPLWLLVALPLTVRSIEVFYLEITKIELGESRFFKMGWVLFGISFLLLAFPVWGIISSMGSKVSNYPEQAVSYLNKHQTPGQVFSTYDWGGYLIWKLQGKKVFIDGRMPSWRWQANLPEESNYAFADYRQLLEGKNDFAKTIKKYKITTLLLPVPLAIKRNFLQNLVYVVSNNVLHLPLKNDLGYTKIVAQVKTAGWKVVYQDQTAVIYRTNP